MVWPCFTVFWSTGHSERKKKKRQTEEEVGRQYQRVDRNGLCQLGQLKTGQDWKGLLRIHLWCPDDLLRLWDRIVYHAWHAPVKTTLVAIGRFRVREAGNLFYVIVAMRSWGERGGGCKDRGRERDRERESKSAISLFLPLLKKSALR